MYRACANYFVIFNAAATVFNVLIYLTLSKVLQQYLCSAYMHYKDDHFHFTHHISETVYYQTRPHLYISNCASKEAWGDGSVLRNSYTGAASVRLLQRSFPTAALQKLECLGVDLYECPTSGLQMRSYRSDASDKCAEELTKTRKITDNSKGCRYQWRNTGNGWDLKKL